MQGCWPSLLDAKLSDILVEPCSHLYVEALRVPDRKSRRALDEEEESGAKEQQAKVG